MSKENEFPRVSEGHVHPAVVHKTTVPCKRDSAGKLYAALSLPQSSFLFRALRSGLLRLAREHLSIEELLQASCAKREVVGGAMLLCHGHEFPRRLPLENIPEAV